MTQHIKEEGLLVHVSLDIHCHEEDGIFVSFVPALDLCSHGDSAEDAIQAGSSAAIIFIDELKRMGTLDEVLRSLGWKRKTDTRSPEDFPYIPPHVIHRTVQLNSSCQA